MNLGEAIHDDERSSRSSAQTDDLSDWRVNAKVSRKLLLCNCRSFHRILTIDTGVVFTASVIIYSQLFICLLSSVSLFI